MSVLNHIKIRYTALAELNEIRFVEHNPRFFTLNIETQQQLWYDYGWTMRNINRLGLTDFVRYASRHTSLRAVMKRYRFWKKANRNLK